MDLEPKHNQAIRDEIGERLLILLSRGPPAAPMRLRTLLRQFDEAHHGSLSMVPNVPSGPTKGSRPIW
jgi:hypothetical protein